MGLYLERTANRPEPCITVVMEQMQFTYVLPMLSELSSLSDNGSKCCIFNCGLCKKILDTAKDESWCYKWIEELRDMEQADADVDCDFQVRLRANPPDSQISHIRAKLAGLQMKMVSEFILIVKKITSVSIKLNFECSHAGHFSMT
jgi:hypothetical protein